MDNNYISKVIFALKPNLIFKLSIVAVSSLIVLTPVNAKEFKQKHHHELVSDGPKNGFGSHRLIRMAFGEKALETPDLYHSNHTGTPHIIEDEDDIVGPHFVFLSHRDRDTDRDKGKTDRQRNEIKIYDKSNPELMGFKNDTMQYRWKFKIDNDFKFSKYFTHFFQIKAKNVSKEVSTNGGESDPLITFTVADQGEDRNEFQLRYSSGTDKEGNKTSAKKLIRKDLTLLSGKWVEFFLQVTYRERGNLHFIAKDVETGEVLIDLNKSKLDLWRGEGKTDFARPKWGIYRSLKEKENLRGYEERARFADFAITKGKLR